MKTIGRLIGATTSYAVQCVSGGERLIPLYCAVDKAGKLTQQRIVGKGFDVSKMFEKGNTGDLVDAKKQGLKVLADNPGNNLVSVFVYDEELEINGEHVCALHCIGNKYEEKTSSVHILVPYSKLDSPDGFKIYMPNPIKLEPDSLDIDEIMNSFISGLQDEEEGFSIFQANFANEEHPAFS